MGAAWSFFSLLVNKAIDERNHQARTLRAQERLAAAVELVAQQQREQLDYWYGFSAPVQAPPVNTPR